MEASANLLRLELTAHFVLIMPWNWLFVKMVASLAAKISQVIHFVSSSLMILEILLKITPYFWANVLYYFTGFTENIIQQFNQAMNNFPVRMKRKENMLCDLKSNNCENGLKCSVTDDQCDNGIGMCQRDGSNKGYRNWGLVNSGPSDRLDIFSNLMNKLYPPNPRFQ